MADTAKFAQPLPSNATHFVDQAGSFLRGAGDRVFTSLIALGEGSSVAAKARAFKALSDLSDEELAERGLTRDGLPVHVFGAFYG